MIKDKIISLDRSLLGPLLAQDWYPESLALGVRDGVLVSGLAKVVGRVLGDKMTTRNWATVMKIHVLID